MTSATVRAIAVPLLLLCIAARADWVQATDPLVIKPNPDLNQGQVQNPPGFTWARHPTAPAAYELEILAAGSPAPTRVYVYRNWYLPTTALPLGNYSWRVRPTSSQDWSSTRPFSITAQSTPFEVTDNVSLRSRIVQRPRPRSLPPSFVPMASWGATQKLEMGPVYSRMYNEVKLQIAALPPLSDARWPLAISSPLTEAMAAQQKDIRERINEASRQLEAAAFLYRLNGDSMYLGEALRKGDQLASLNPQGPTSYLNQDQATRQIALSLIKAVDFLATNLDAGRKARWLAAVTLRTDAIYADLAGDNGRMDQWPFDSHGNTGMGFLVLISSLALGDIPQAQAWFDFSFRAYANSPSPWSGPEGGYANGTAYAEYTAGYLVTLWDPLAHVTGVNFFASPWALGFLDFLAQFTPPGSASHAFGDGAETRPDPRVARAFASRMSSPHAAWLVKTAGGSEDSLSLLQAAYPMPVSSANAAPPSNSALFPSIGWTAMHCDISAPGRTSVYFKSSPYGSFNHSHGDQNGFLLSVAGQPLLIKSGYYDWYGSPNWLNWYRQTRSQNAITFDGGKGQNVDGYRETLQHNGKITSFAAQPGYDFAEGDATLAYAGLLSSAKRQLWHLRIQNAVLIRDRLTARVPHVYEFNLHAPSTIMVENAASVKIAANGQSVCVRSLGAGATFQKRAGGLPAPGRVEDHGLFALSNDGKAPAEFLVLLDVGCRRPVVTVSTQGTGTGQVRIVKVGVQSVTLN